MRFFLLLLLPIAGWATAAERFTFAALGCMPYGLPETGPAFVRVIDEINRHAPAFTVHCGDIKGGAEPSSLEGLATMRDYFMRFEGPLIYTPGDNEWTDVHRPAAGGHDPIVWLGHLRTKFFAGEHSLGQTALPLITQRRDPTHGHLVENARWERGGIVFATLHVVGSNNNRQPEVPGAMAEFQARDAANRAWLRETFALARASDARGVALFFQAAPFAEDFGRDGRDPGFKDFLDALEAECREFARPVLLVHADKHHHRINPAVRFERDAPRLPNVTRVETFGDEDFHAVLVVVDPDAPEVFLPAPLIVPGNPLPRHWTPPRH